MRVLLYHVLSCIGGGEKLALAMASTLARSGFNVEFTTLDMGFRGEYACRLLGEDCSGVVFRYYEPPLTYRILSLTGRFTRYRVFTLLRSAIESLNLESYDLSIDTWNNMLTPFDIVYIHYPVKITSSGRRGLHWRLYDLVVKRVAEGIRGSPRLILTNSSWTARLTHDVFGVEARVLYPPVDTDYLRVDVDSPRKPIIVTISRFSSTKNLQPLLHVARVLRNYHFVFIGSTEKSSGPILQEFKEAMKSLDNVELHIDAPRDLVKSVLSEAMIYLHPPRPEPFGIAIVEAMSAGLVPIVYRDGGAWTDIVSKLDSNLGYRDISEIPSIVRYIERNHRVLAKRAQELSEKYSRRRFEEDLMKYINEVLGERGK